LSLLLLQATAHEDLKRLLGKAQAIDELESTIPSFIEHLMPHNYPAYVHVLRVSSALAPHATARRPVTHGVCAVPLAGWNGRSAGTEFL
jgi:hypothetical protein